MIGMLRSGAAAGGVGIPRRSLSLSQQQALLLVRRRVNRLVGCPSHSSSSPPKLSSTEGVSGTMYYGPKPFGSFHLGTTEYASCFQNLPRPNPDEFRSQALDYLDSFDSERWFNDPVCSILNGEALSSHENDTIVVDTLSALGQVNGKQVYANASQMQAIATHITTYQSPYKDCRDIIRLVEQDLLTDDAGALIGNQCLDFGKQDGVTELEEMVMACVVERRLNDYLILEETMKRLTVNRKPIYVSLVSNFSNFLDLSRKTFRSLELGIPVVILARTNHTQQHSYRWTQLLLQHAIHKHGLDPGMITFVSCGLPQLKHLLQTCSIGNLYMTGSRELAKQIKSIYPNTIASTGGPNTMVICTPQQENAIDPYVAMMQDQQAKEKEALEPAGTKTGTGTGTGTEPGTTEEEQGLPPSPPQPIVKKKAPDTKQWFGPHLKKAIQLSATIESSGQCTALRHVIVPPNFDEQDIAVILGSAPTATSPQDALRNQQCDGILDAVSATPPPEGYRVSGSTYWKLNEKLPTTPMPEHWRQVVVDYTKLETNAYDYTNIDQLAHWLNTTQPISLAVNGHMVDAYKTVRRLFERTSLAVYTVGGLHHDTIFTSPANKTLPPAMTCQARPQDGEIFGEVPPRKQLQQYTKFPVYIPSSNPSYDTTYTLEYLHKQAATSETNIWNDSSRALLDAVQDQAVRGYCMLLIDYLRNVDDDNPKQVMVSDGANRTVLWGIQRPPLQMITVFRATTTRSQQQWWDACAPAVLLFHTTNARYQFQLSLDADSPHVAQQESFCQMHKLPYVIETTSDLEQRIKDDEAKGYQSSLFQVVSLPLSHHLHHQTSMTMKDVTTTKDNDYFPMVAQYTSLFFPMGHIKSTSPNDIQFLDRIRAISNKWIQTLF